ncbi:hypothetical protein T484DRAFT_1805107 [Baffinella frigidus]|nr:hypothetical protein T484DRAFT_1805107 [Cryptophyta sp. CCMP2293]
MAGIEIEEMDEWDRFVLERDIEVAMAIARRRALPDASFLPEQTTCICMLGQTLMEAVGMGAVPRLRKEGMGPMAADVWGNQELVRMMVPCKALRCSGAVKSDEDSDADAGDGRCEQTVCGVHLRKPGEPSDDGPIARGFWGCVGCDGVWCDGCKPALEGCEVCEVEDRDWHQLLWDKMDEEKKAREAEMSPASARGSDDPFDDYQEEEPPDKSDWDRLVNPKP